MTAKNPLIDCGLPQFGALPQILGTWIIVLALRMFTDKFTLPKCPTADRLAITVMSKPYNRHFACVVDKLLCKPDWTSIATADGMFQFFFASEWRAKWSYRPLYGGGTSSAFSSSSTCIIAFALSIVTWRSGWTTNQARIDGNSCALTMFGMSLTHLDHPIWYLMDSYRI